MPRRTQYYTLVASLPALPRPRQAERLPINDARLEARLRMLGPEDAEIVARLRKFIQWQNHPPHQTDTDIAREYRELVEQNAHPAVRSAIEFRMNLRTVLAAMRHRRRGEKEAPPGHEWGVGPWVRHIETNWNHPDFKLANVFPWIPEMRGHFENNEPLKLEELAMNLVWDAFDRSAFGIYFGIETVIAYLFKWDILQRWLSYREEAARQQFESLAASLFSGETTPMQPAATTAI